MHFFIGSILWGLIFAATAPMWPGSSYLANGASFSVAAWLLMMIVAMPMAGVGFFGMGLGIMAPIATLILHVIYGLVLGAVFERLESRAPHSARAGHWRRCRSWPGVTAIQVLGDPSIRAGSGDRDSTDAALLYAA